MNNLKEGEIWFFGSIQNDNKKYEKFLFGHMGISFNRIDFFDKEKHIYAFGPTRSYKDDKELSVPGDFRDDILYFRSFYNICSNNKNPIWTKIKVIIQNICIVILAPPLFVFCFFSFNYLVR